MTNHSDFQKILAKPAQRALAGANIETLEQLSKYSEAEIMELHGRTNRVKLGSRFIND